MSKISLAFLDGSGNLLVYMSGHSINDLQQEAVNDEGSMRFMPLVASLRMLAAAFHQHDNSDQPDDFVTECTGKFMLSRIGINEQGFVYGESVTRALVDAVADSIADVVGDGKLRDIEPGRLVDLVREATRSD